MGARLIVGDGNRMVSMPSLGVQNDGIGDLEVEGSNPSPGIKEVDWDSLGSGWRGIRVLMLLGMF